MNEPDPTRPDSAYAEAPDFHLAQFNIGRLRLPLDSAEIAGFVAEFDPVNALADAADGFVWRLQDEHGDATGFRPYGDMVIVNYSVWTTLAALRNFVYCGRHLDMLRRRREWFARMAEHHLVMWWVPAGHIPLVPDAVARLEQLRAHGPGPEAFTFRQPYPPPKVGRVHSRLT